MLLDFSIYKACFGYGAEVDGTLQSLVFQAFDRLWFCVHRLLSAEQLYIHVEFQ